MTESRRLLQRFLAALAYRRQKALRAGTFAPPALDTFDAEVDRFQATLAALRDDFADPSLTASISDEQFLQGPLADAMTHAGQLALLRRLAGSPVPSENFIFADVRSDRVSRSQAAPRAPDLWWHADGPPPSPGPDHPALRPRT